MHAKNNCKIVTKIETLKKKFIILILLSPDVHNTINSFSLSNFSIVIIIATRNDSGINLVNILTTFREEYLI